MKLHKTTCSNNWQKLRLPLSFLISLSIHAIFAKLIIFKAGISLDMNVSTKNSIIVYLTKHETAINQFETNPSFNNNPTSPSIVPTHDSSVKKSTIFETSRPYYFKASELSQKPKVLIDIPFDLAQSIYSKSSKQAILHLMINELGNIDNVIIDSSDFSEQEQKLISAAFKNTKFDPGKIDGNPVKSHIKIEVLFETDKTSYDKK